jgi:formamidopyrimidine-DNA glycosylase
MPELPEVETTLNGIKPYITHQQVTNVIVREPQLRWPIPKALKTHLLHHSVQSLSRRGKYLLIQFDNGTLLLHLGMSGRLCVLSEKIAPKKHDHIDICFANHYCLRFTDPRRFGAVLWTNKDPAMHALIKHMGPEPLTEAFHHDYLWERAHKRKISIKSYIMNGKTVAGVGNIYATEALFLAHIHPERPACSVSQAEFQQLTTIIKSILKKAIEKGGTTLKDFMKPSGSPGYFAIELNAYGREGKPCPRCKTTLKMARIGQRSTVYCPTCQQ